MNLFSLVYFINIGFIFIPNITKNSLYIIEFKIKNKIILYKKKIIQF